MCMVLDNYIIVCCTQCAGVNEDGFPGMFSSPQTVIVVEVPTPPTKCMQECHVTSVYLVC